MRIRRSHLLLILLALLLASPASSSVVFITLDDNGRQFALDRGDALEISLPATSGTGYTWQAEPVAGGFVNPVGEPRFKLDSATPGAPGHQIFLFAVQASGNGALEMRYVRPWEKDTPPAKVFKIMLVVH